MDLWQGGKSYVSRICCWHVYATTLTTVSYAGGYRGLVKNDFLCIASGGTVQLGDTITVAGVTYVVIKRMAAEGTSSQTICWITRPV